jgi:hypothetical protein
MVGCGMPPPIVIERTWRMTWATIAPIEEQGKQNDRNQRGPFFDCSDGMGKLRPSGRWEEGGDDKQADRTDDRPGEGVDVERG